MPKLLEQINKAALLARINIDYNSKAEGNILRDLCKKHTELVFSNIDNFDKFIKEDTEPLFFPVSNLTELREDNIIKNINTEDILANAPKKEDTFFVVPHVL